MCVPSASGSLSQDAGPRVRTDPVSPAASDAVDEAAAEAPMASGPAAASGATLPPQPASAKARTPPLPMRVKQIQFVTSLLLCVVPGLNGPPAMMPAGGVRRSVPCSRAGCSREPGLDPGDASRVADATAIRVNLEPRPGRTPWNDPPPPDW